MYHLVADFGNTNIFEMLGEFFKSLPELLLWLLMAFASNLYWIIPAVLIIAVLVWVKLYAEVYKERKAFIRELSKWNAEIKTSAFASLFAKKDSSDIILTSTKGKKLALKFFPCTKKRMNVHFFDAENCIVSQNVIQIDGREITGLGGEQNAKAISEKISRDTRTKALNLSFKAYNECEKVLIFIPSASKITYVKPSGDVIEIRDGDNVFGIKLTSKGTFIRFLEEVFK